jgi:arsenite methyltransferase
MIIQPDSVHETVREHYAEQARSSASCCGSDSTSACCDSKNILYADELLSSLPADVTGFSLGSGDPVTPAALQPGETVLDLGSGGGLDCFLAARQVGENGKVIGVDMTPEMLARASASAERLGVHNVEFREGYLENLPVEDDSVDVVISNCVVNLSPDKPQVIREMLRVLKPGGRVSISDIVTNRPFSEQQRANKDTWCECVTGALTRQEYIREMEAVGFVDVQILPDMKSIEKAVASGEAQVGSGEKLSTEELLEHVRDWENLEGTLAAPHLISARKPA